MKKKCTLAMLSYFIYTLTAFTPGISSPVSRILMSDGGSELADRKLCCRFKRKFKHYLHIGANMFFVRPRKESHLVVH